jgi:hypothetical protein
MKATKALSLLAALTGVFLIVLAWEPGRVTTGLLAQGAGAQAAPAAQGPAGQGGGRAAQPAGVPGQVGGPGAPGGGRGRGRGRGAPVILGPPAGVTPLETDLFSSKNFYKDSANWLDKRYYRCNTSVQLYDMWNTGRIGPNPPTSASWGNCDADWDRSRILSPYPYKTAKEHYEALLAQAKAKGGPTVYTKATVPDWDGYYRRDTQADHGSEWIWGVAQAPTVLSVLTPEYQKRMVQGIYHEAVTNAPQWAASFCWPEGFIRWWAQPSRAGDFQLTMTTWNVQMISGIADNFLRQVMVGKEKHVQTVPQWYGETIGFWDGTTLVTWTANIQGWELSHAMFETSDKLETVETFKPAYDAGGKFIGLDHEAIFYDPEAFVAPLRASYRFVRAATPEDPTRRYTYIECLSNIFNTNGKPQQTTNADPRYVDYYGRPWAKNWEKYFEQGWDKPQDDVPDAVLNIFK